MLTVSINGESIQLDNQPTVAEILSKHVSKHVSKHASQHDQTNKHVAVAINGEFVPRSQYTQVHINNNDDIDIVTAVGGG